LIPVKTEIDAARDRLDDEVKADSLVSVRVFIKQAGMVGWVQSLGHLPETLSFSREPPTKADTSSATSSHFSPNPF
jgi:hypothetical protein